MREAERDCGWLMQRTPYGCFIYCTITQKKQVIKDSLLRENNRRRVGEKLSLLRSASEWLLGKK